jgi:hypothetical protein
MGGNGGYTYLWNTGETTASLQGLKSGLYSVTAKDVKGCNTAAQFTLIDPAKFVINLGPDIEMCEGQNITIHSNTSNATYNWSSSNGFTSTQSDVSVNKPGIYTLTATNQNGCEAQDNIELKINQDLLKTDFLMATEAHRGDSIAVIDISWPLPENITWDFGPEAKLIFNDNDWAIIRFDTVGTFTIGLTSQLATCNGHHEQQITILEKTNPDGGRVASGLILDAQIFPNPTDGHFQLRLDLSSEIAVDVRLVSLSNERTIFSERLSGTDQYVKEYDFTHLTSGIYFLFVKAGRESRIIRLVIM